MRKTHFLAILSACCLAASILTGCSMDSIIEGAPSTIADPIPPEKVSEGFYIRTAAGEYYKPTTSCTSYKRTDGKNYDKNGRYVYSVADKKFIPVCYADDSLIYVSSESVPSALYCEEFQDFGYAVGAAGLALSKDGTIPLTAKSCLAGSSIESVIKKTSEKKTFLVYSVNGNNLKSSALSSIGTLGGYDKNEDVVLESYVGTFYKQLTVKADTHFFASDNLSVVKSFSRTKDGYVLINDRPGPGYYDINCEGLIQISDKNRPVPTEEEG